MALRYRPIRPHLPPPPNLRRLLPKSNDPPMRTKSSLMVRSLTRPNPDNSKNDGVTEVSVTEVSATVDLVTVDLVTGDLVTVDLVTGDLVTV
jgi:hypothetical protein